MAIHPRANSFFPDSPLTSRPIHQNFIMHFIQNSWFTHNWIFLLIFLMGVLSVVAYINNKRRLFTFASISLSSLMAFTFWFMLLPDIHQSIESSRQLLPSLNVGRSSEEQLSAFSKMIRFLADIIKDRLFD
jgi:hypothetical protein